MKKWPALLLLAAIAVSAETLSQADRTKAVAELEGSRKMFLDATKDLSAAQWNFKPAPDRWSVAECAQHIALSEDFIFARIGDILKTPATPEKREAVKGKDESVLKLVQDRSQKFKAPEPLNPTTHPMAPEESVKKFLDSRTHTLDWVKTTQEDLRNHFYDHPVPAIGTLDAYQWTLLLSAHTRRHTLQILEVKADPNFPKE